MTATGQGGRHQAGRHRERRPAGRLLVRVAVGALAAVGSLAAVAGLVAMVLPPSTSAAPPSSQESDAAVPVSISARSGTAREQAAPTRVRVPAIGVDSSLQRLAVDGSRALVPPTDFARAGWFDEGPAPGETGPAVIAGHVDSRRGPAVFFRLAELEPGDDVLVDRADGTTARFTVSSVQRHPKDRFPTDQVYGPTPRAELRLITCGGEFDRAARSYRDNVVVNAVLAS